MQGIVEKRTVQGEPAGEKAKGSPNTELRAMALLTGKLRLRSELAKWVLRAVGTEFVFFDADNVYLQEGEVATEAHNEDERPVLEERRDLDEPYTQRWIAWCNMAERNATDPLEKKGIEAQMKYLGSSKEGVVNTINREVKITGIWGTRKARSTRSSASRHKACTSGLCAKRNSWTWQWRLHAASSLQNLVCAPKN